MARSSYLPGPQPLSGTRGRLSIPVPWEDADEFQGRLRRHGIGSTLCLDPGSGEAHLEVWPGVEAALVQAVLGI